MSPLLETLRQFFSELKRRKVYRVGGAYLAVAIVSFQAVEMLIPATTLPGWADELILAFLIAGFPVSLVVAWAFEMSPEGMRWTPETAGGGALRSGAMGPGGAPDVEAASRAAEGSIAVLPFAALGREKPGVLAEGMHDALLTRLSNVAGLTVISRTSVQRYRGTEKSIGEIARHLGVKWVLEGGVQEWGDRIQVNVQLIDPRSDTHAWAESYRRDLTAEDLFDLQSEITRRIAGSLEARLTEKDEARIGKAPTEVLDAYRLCVRGRSLLDQRSEKEIRSARDNFQRAIELDADYALAWSGLADAQSLMWAYDYESREGVSEDALHAAQRAVDLDPGLAEARTSLGIIRSLRHEGPAAYRELRRATELKPSYAEGVVWLGWLQLVLGRPAKAVESLARAVELDPMAPAHRVYLCEAQLAEGHYEEALRQGRRARELRSDYGLAHFMVGLVHHHAGRHPEARTAWERARSLVPPEGAPTHAEILAATATALAAEDDRRGAMATLAEVDGEESPFSVGLVHAAVGQLDEAFRAFERVTDWGAFANDHLRYFFPEALDPVRRDSRCEELLHRVNTHWGLNPDGSLPDEGF